MNEEKYEPKVTAQGVLNEEQTAASCGTACGATDNEAPKKEEATACGTACGATDGEETKKEEPSVGGTACGAGE
jgi:ACGX-repeat protein